MIPQTEKITRSILFQASFWSTALKTLISVSTVILLGLIFAYHALEVQVRIAQSMHTTNVHLNKCGKFK